MKSAVTVRGYATKGAKKQQIEAAGGSVGNN